MRNRLKKNNIRSSWQQNKLFSRLLHASRLVENYRRATLKILSAVKHVRPHIFNKKFGKQRRFHFSRPSALEALIPRETLGQ